MSKIQELINNPNTILVFDIDGVLAKMEYGEYNHYALNDEEWNKAILSGDTFYNDNDSIKTMKDYISTRNIDNIYVCSKSYSKQEDDMKTKFIINNYNIKEDNIYYVKDNNDKLEILRKIKDLNSSVPDNHIAMVDDTIDVLNYIMDNSKFATIHISSFM